MIARTFYSRLGCLLSDHCLFDHVTIFDDRIEVENHLPPEMNQQVMRICADLLGAEFTVEPAGRRTRITFRDIEEPVIVPAGRRFLVWDRGWRTMSRQRLRASLRRQGLTQDEATIIIMEASERGCLLLGDIFQILESN